MRKAYLAIVALAMASAPASADGWAEKMFKDGLTHDFGVVPRGAQLVHRFTITNIYAVRMEITGIKSGCGCVSASMAKRVLESKESAVLEVRMDGKRFAGPKTVGVSVTVGPEFISTAELKVTANGRTDIVFNPGQVDFGAVGHGQTPLKTIDVEYAGLLDWKVEQVLAKDVPYTAKIEELYRRRTRTGNQIGYRLSVAIKADAPVGTHRHNLYLKTNDPTNSLVPVLIESSVQSLVQVAPPQLDLGAIRTDTQLIRRVVVRGNTAFTIKGVKGTGNGVEIGEVPDRAATAHFLTFKCQATKEGAFRHELAIETSLQDTPVIVVIEGTASK
jgi:Protein of unknown function (DUF1573)